MFLTNCSIHILRYAHFQLIFVQHKNELFHLNKKYKIVSSLAKSSQTS
jgi:hypothetical protein